MGDAAHSQNFQVAVPTFINYKNNDFLCRQSHRHLLLAFDTNYHDPNGVATMMTLVAPVGLMLSGR